MGSFLRITCTQPGLRRACITHPAVKVWPADAWTPEQLALLRADPAFTVEGVDADASSAVGRAALADALGVPPAQVLDPIHLKLVELIVEARAHGALQEQFLGTVALLWDACDPEAFPNTEEPGAPQGTGSDDADPVDAEGASIAAATAEPDGTPGAEAVDTEAASAPTWSEDDNMLVGPGERFVPKTKPRRAKATG